MCVFDALTYGFVMNNNNHASSFPRSGDIHVCVCIYIDVRSGTEQPTAVGVN